MVTGVTQGYEKKLEIVGVGYRVIARGQNLEFALGYSHPTVEAPAGIAFAVDSPTRFSVQGIDKQQVGEIAANIRKLRKPGRTRAASATPESRFAVVRKAGRSNVSRSPGVAVGITTGPAPATAATYEFERRSLARPSVRGSWSRARSATWWCKSSTPRAYAGVGFQHGIRLRGADDKTARPARSASGLQSGPSRPASRSLFSTGQATATTAEWPQWPTVPAPAA